jgi:hypothetical protein
VAVAVAEPYVFDFNHNDNGRLEVSTIALLVAVSELWRKHFGNGNALDVGQPG